jgi:hypothetical protein
MNSFHSAVFFGDISPTVFLAVGYALFLLALAGGLELLARNAHHRSQRFRTAGFIYHKHIDTWECSQGQHLLPTEVGHERRLVRYRARADVCNHCPLKQGCTDSNEGREIVRFLDPWPHSEIGRFHRGLSLVLGVLAAIIVVATMSSHHHLHELMVLGTALTFIVLVSLRLLASFRASLANFPDGDHSKAGAGSSHF